MAAGKEAQMLESAQQWVNIVTTKCMTFLFLGFALRYMAVIWRYVNSPSVLHSNMLLYYICRMNQTSLQLPSPADNCGKPPGPSKALGYTWDLLDRLKQLTMREDVPDSVSGRQKLNLKFMFMRITGRWTLCSDVFCNLGHLCISPQLYCPRATEAINELFCILHNDVMSLGGILIRYFTSL